MKHGVRGMVAAALLCLATPAVQANTATIPPTDAEVRFYTQPLVRARLRLPDSLQAFVVTAITPLVDDPVRFSVTVQFRAKTPFGGVTEHRAGFSMKRSTSQRVWIVTSD